jgi:uncharacterized protein with FMN-binding domain
MKIFIIVIIIVVIITVPMLYFMFYGLGSVKKLIINEVDLSKINDGTYKGSFHKNRWNYDLEITVKNHKITSVKNTNKKMEMFKELNDKFYSELLEKQRIPFDTVSGATVHTKAFLKAAENALTSGK